MDFPQLIDIENIENFHVKTLNGTAFGWKNWYFSPKVALLISRKKSLEICSFDTERYSIWLENLQLAGYLLKMLKICYFFDSIEIW